MIKCQPKYTVPRIRFARSIGDRAVTLSYPPDSDRIIYGRIVGNSVLSDSGELIGVGTKSGTDFTIPLLAKGKNLISEELFVTAGQKAGYLLSINPTFYTCRGSASVTGNVIISSEDVIFKKNTPYTLVLKAIFESAPSQKYCDTHLAFLYTDGTKEPLSKKSTVKNQTLLFTSDKSKTLSAIIASIVTNRSGNAKITRDTIGLFEGELTSYPEGEIEYRTLEGEIRIPSPLCSVGYISDELDLISGEIIRKTVTQEVNGEEFYESEYEGIFYLDLPIFAGRGCDMISLFPIYKDTETLIAADRGIVLNEDGEGIYIKGEATDIEGIKAEFSENPVLLHYIRAERPRERASLDIPFFDGYTYLLLTGDIAPKRVFYEYKTEES